MRAVAMVYRKRRRRKRLRRDGGLALKEVEEDGRDR